jgi:pilus assembly protein Flp/PilA
MSGVTSAVRRFVRDEDGAALVEYGILVALIAVVAIVVISTVGTKISAKFQEVANKL